MEQQTTIRIPNILRGRRGTTLVLAISCCLTAATSVPAYAQDVRQAPPTTTAVITAPVQRFSAPSGAVAPAITRDALTVTTPPPPPPPAPVHIPVRTQARTPIAAASSVAAVASAAPSLATGSRATVVQAALSYLGVPYVFGGASRAGVDCSGLVMLAYASIGVPLAHFVGSQDARGVRIPASEAQPGDLVVFDNEDHDAIYLGNGMLVAAPKTGDVVKIQPVWAGIPHHFTRILG